MAESSSSASWLARLHASGLAADTTQLLDALWLSTHLPAQGWSPVVPRDTQRDAAPPTSAAVPRAPLRPPAGAPPTDARNLVDVTISGTPATPPVTSAQGVYAQSQGDAGGAAGDDALRARAVRVAGVTALRDAPALARALRPLGKRRRSRTRFQLDEAATVERYADTGSLVPVMGAERERFFAATLLVEDTLALPLWRGLAAELEALLERQGGFRSFRRLELASVADRLRVRHGRGPWQWPRVLQDDDATLVLLATDGTTDAWADGRMAALLQELGTRTCLAIVQWMPERLWPHTALGGAELSASAARAATPNAELRITRPRWLAADEPVLPVPIAALTPAAWGRLAGVLMGKPGARIGAAAVWTTPAEAEIDAEGQTHAETPPSTPAERVARFRSVASARVLQAAVQLSAAAPLTLPVVRLVHRVMQPDAPAEDLPLLLLGGLLERKLRAAPAEGDTPALGRAGQDPDNEVEFDFAPGVRALLQASLLKHEADAVRRSVSGYIAERTGSPVDFTALLLDPAGALTLPAWARPFAELTRQMDQLFRRDDAPRAPAPTVREQAWSDGVTVQASAGLPGRPTKLAWSPDGRRLAVLHEYGLALWRLEDTGPGQRRLAPEPLAMSKPAQVMFVKGFGVADAAHEALIDAVRTGLRERFRGEWKAHFHTVSEDYRRNPHRAPGAEISQMLRLAAKPRALVCFIGNQAFFDSQWMRHANTQVQRQFDLSLPPPVLSLVAEAEVGSVWQHTRWQIGRAGGGSVTGSAPDPGMMTSQGSPAAAGNALVGLLWRLGARAVPEVAFGSNACGIAWNHQGDLLVVDAARRLVVREHDLHQYQAYPKDMESGARPDIEAHPTERALAFITATDVCIARPDAKPERLTLTTGPLLPASGAWSLDGKVLLVRAGNGEMHHWEAGTWTPWPAPNGVPALGPRRAHRSNAWAVCDTDAQLTIHDRRPLRKVPVHQPVESIAWSHDDTLLACSASSGRIQVIDCSSEARQERLLLDTANPEAEEGAATLLQFVPRPLDDGFEALAVAHGHSLTLLRIDTRGLRDLVKTAAASTSVQPEPSGALQGEAALEACREVAHMLALAFQLGALLPQAALAAGVQNTYLTLFLQQSRHPEGSADADLARLLTELAPTLDAPLRTLLAGEHGPSSTGSVLAWDAGDLAELTLLWSAWSSRLLTDGSAAIRVRADHPSAARSWAHVAAYARSRQLDIEIERHTQGPSGAVTCTLDPKTYLALVFTLSDILIHAVDQRTGRSLPARWAVPGLTVLWADDNPMYNVGAFKTLAERGIRVLPALSTEAALTTLAIEPVVVVISDMGRPPDTHAGYTLLDAMREHGHMQPFLIYSRAPQPGHDDEARRRGAIGTTDRFDELLQWLRDLLIGPSPPAQTESAA